MSVVDMCLTIAVVLGAASFLVWNLAGRGPKPACHTSSGQAAAPRTDVVIIGGALQKGLDRAKQRRR
jgi:hypothetical protein